MSRSFYTQEQKNQVIELYKDRTKSIKEIAGITNVHPTAVSKIAAEAGLPLRHPKNAKVVCQKCGHVCENAAKFCSMCGAEILSPKRSAIKASKSLYRLVPSMPSSIREKVDEYIKIIDHYIANSKEAK